MIKWEWTIPNILSLIRIALVPVFAALYLQSAQNPVLLWWAVAVLALSGLTDLVDGKIARALNQVSEIGKVLDPIADKITQVTVVFCLAIRMPQLWPLLILCAVKEILQAIGAFIMFRRGVKVQSARWYGKVSTFVFYFAMALVVVFPPRGKPLLFGWNMPLWLFGVLIFLVTACMLYAFYQYVLLYRRLTAQQNRMRETPTDTISGDSEEEIDL